MKNKPLKTIISPTIHNKHNSRDSVDIRWAPLSAIILIIDINLSNYLVITGNYWAFTITEAPSACW
jgi:hypothetical protein